MTDSSDSRSDQLVAWAREQLDRAVRDLLRLGALNGELIEIKPVWTLPRSLVIGEAREQGDSQRSVWIICGESTLDCIESRLATSPRDAARHFAMKWQLDAERHRDPGVRQKLDPDSKRDWEVLCKDLQQKAESLFELVSQDFLW
ncbi:MAG: DUF4826 family protein [Gammaproteobacteria bacterium]|nr:DUF4826 family protein [Gammaproteobacteria bacterium]